MVNYYLVYVLMSLISESILLTHKQTQFVPFLKLGLYILTGTQKIKEKIIILAELKKLSTSYFKPVVMSFIIISYFIILAYSGLLPCLYKHHF